MVESPRVAWRGSNVPATGKAGLPGCAWRHGVAARASFGRRVSRWAGAARVVLLVVNLASAVDGCRCF